MDAQYLQDAYINIGLLLQPYSTRYSSSSSISGSNGRLGQDIKTEATQSSMENNEISQNQNQQSQSPTPIVKRARIGNIEVEEYNPDMKCFCVKSLIISAFDGKKLSIAIGILAYDGKVSFTFPSPVTTTNMLQTCFSIALIPSDSIED